MKKTIAYEIYQLTKKLHNEVVEKKNLANRDELINKFDRYIELRQKLINQLPEQINPTDKQFINNIIELQKEIDITMNSLHTELQSDIKDLNNKLRIQQKYDNPYPQFDGHFIDKKR